MHILFLQGLCSWRSRQWFQRFPSRWQSQPFKDTHAGIWMSGVLTQLGMKSMRCLAVLMNTPRYAGIPAWIDFSTCTVGTLNTLWPVALGMACLWTQNNSPYSQPGLLMGESIPHHPAWKGCSTWKIIQVGSSPGHATAPNLSHQCSMRATKPAPSCAHWACSVLQRSGSRAMQHLAGRA